MFRFTNVDGPVEIRLNSSWHPLGVHPNTFNIEGRKANYNNYLKKLFLNLFVARNKPRIMCVQKNGCREIKLYEIV